MHGQTYIIFEVMHLCYVSTRGRSRSSHGLTSILQPLWNRNPQMVGRIRDHLSNLHHLLSSSNPYSPSLHRHSIACDFGVTAWVSTCAGIITHFDRTVSWAGHRSKYGTVRIRH